MDQKTLYTRALSADFLYWLNENKLLKTFKSNPLLNIGMRGNKIIQVSQVNRKSSSLDIKEAQGFPHIAENE